MIGKHRLRNLSRAVHRYIIVFIIINVMAAGTVNAVWDPEFCFEETSKDITVLDSKGFKDLKKKVIEYLAGSWCSAEKAELLMDVVLVTRPKVCVEVGAFTGSSVLPVAAALKYVGQGQILAIDAWSNKEAIKHLDEEDPNRAWWAQVDMNAVYNTFQQTIKTWSLSSYCVSIRAPSNKAVKQMGDIDFLHLDGDYSEKGSLEDTSLYLPKVKSGGYIVVSNYYLMVKNKQTKLASCNIFFDSCDFVGEVDNGNTILFRKN
jgi:hypothetical protein